MTAPATDRMAKARAAKAEKAARQEIPEGSEVPLPVKDAASALFRDRSGQKLGGGVAEGKANFAAVTQGAIQSVKDRTHEEAIEEDVRRGTTPSEGT